jgi:hypothetical protein
MHQPVRQSLLIIVLSLFLLPAIGSAGGVGVESPPGRPEQTVNDTVSSQIPGLPQLPDVKFHEAGAPPDALANPDSHSPNISPEDQRARIKVVYDPETETDRGKMMALVIAFGISLALNIYLATALFSAKRGM